MSLKLWLRAEVKKNECRVAVVPEDAAKLVAAGFDVTVERSADRCIPAGEYAAVGCHVADEGGWTSAPGDAFILGIKELPAGDAPLIHRHIYFGHVFKDQPGWQKILGRFVAGGGTLLDLECLVDENNRRLAAFGYWAGYGGAAVAVQAWCGQQQNRVPAIASVHDYPDTTALIGELQAQLQGCDGVPDMLVVGALGRSGRGAVDLAERLGLAVSKWDMAETASGGPFPEIRRHNLFVNCILAGPGCPPFVTADDVAAADRRLSVISDVSCDPESRYNPIPIYHRTTTFNDPLIRITDGPPPLDIIAIDHLPSMLPLESSTDYSRQLTPVLLQLADADSGVWARARRDFTTHIARL